MSLKTLVVLGSSRLPLEQRLGDRVGRFIAKSVSKRNDKLSTVDYVDLGKVRFPLLEKPHYHYKDPKEAPQILQDYAKKIQDSDVFIIISPEYNNSVPPAISNFLDNFSPRIFIGKPSMIVSYSNGPFGGVRAAMQLRAMLAELAPISVPATLPIPSVQNCLTPEGDPQNNESGGFVVKGFEVAIKQLEWYGEAMKRQRETAGLP